VRSAGLAAAPLLAGLSVSAGAAAPATDVAFD